MNKRRKERGMTTKILNQFYKIKLFAKLHYIFIPTQVEYYINYP